MPFVRLADERDSTVSYTGDGRPSWAGLEEGDSGSDSDRSDRSEFGRARSVSGSVSGSDFGSQRNSPRWVSPTAMHPPGFSSPKPAPPTMREALSKGQTHYESNGMWADWVFFLRNNHGMLVLFLADPMHPHTALHRALGLWNSLAFGFLAVAVVATLFPPGKGAVPHVLGFTTLPITLGALLQALLWDVPTARLGVLCARLPDHRSADPPSTRAGRYCSLASFVCGRVRASRHGLVGVVFVLLGACIFELVKLFDKAELEEVSPPASSSPNASFLPSCRLLSSAYARRAMQEERHVMADLLPSKLLSFALAVPISSLVFLVARAAELRAAAAAAAARTARVGTPWSAPSAATAHYPSPAAGSQARFVVYGGAGGAATEARQSAAPAEGEQTRALW